MANVDLVYSEGKRPASLTCPHCKKTLLMGLEPFQNDIGAVPQSNCPHCRGVIFSCIILLGNSSMKDLGETVKAIVELMAGKTDPHDKGFLTLPGRIK